jgi:AraC family transcriptional regulator
MDPLSRSPAAAVERALAARARSGAPGGTASRPLASGDGWSVSDVVCTSGPDDRPFEERHSRVGIAVVAAGSFGYRAGSGRALLSPGSLLLGNAGACFECGHDHGAGDRCVAFHYEPELFERLAADAGAGRSERRFRVPRLPPLRVSASLVARALAGLERAPSVPEHESLSAKHVRQRLESNATWEELALELAARVVVLAAGLPRGGAPLPLAAEAKVARAVRAIEAEPDGDHGLSQLARRAGLSPYHFLRSFERVTGATPHQFVLRTRLRAAALRLAAEKERVVEVAYASGFGDLSNFNRSFKSEFGATPSAYARDLGGRSATNGSSPTRFASVLRIGSIQREAGGTTPFSRA